MELPRFPHFITDSLKREMVRAKRLHGRFACLLITINDSLISQKYGYRQRDKILETCGDIIRKNCRVVDVWGHDGHGKFLVILPETNRPNAEIFSRRVTGSLRKIQLNHIRTPEEIDLELTVGLSLYPDPRARTETDLIALAVEALNMAKGQANQSCIVA